MMTTSVSPLLFPETLNSPGLWKALAKTHLLNQNDFDWLAHVKLASHTLRNEQKPPMLAQRIRITAGTQSPVTLAGSFILSATPDDNGAILYTPYDGIKKYDSLASLQTALEERVKEAAEEDELLAFLGSLQRQQLVEQTSIALTYETIEGDVFDDRKAAILASRQLNAEAMLSELKQLPSLTALLETSLDELLKEHFPNLQQGQTRTSFYTLADPSAKETSARHWHDSTSLSEAVLMRYRQQNWPAGQLHEFSNPRHTPIPGDQALWDNALKAASGKLLVLLFHAMESYWDGASADGSTRRVFFAKALLEQARTELMIKRETGIIDAAQFATLHQMIRPAALPTRRATIENVRLWEYEPNYVELAGSLMISFSEACLYTPTLGLQVLKDYQDLKDTVQSKFLAAGHEDELYGLLSLEERKRFVGFDKPHVTGVSIGGEIFEVLFEAIITKQRQNIEYALQVFRFSDGAVDIHALFDKALDIRAMIQERLLELDAGERWTTRPVLVGVQQPSAVLAEKADNLARSCTGVEALLTGSFRGQPIATAAAQRSYLEGMQSRLGHSLYVGVRGEAQLRELSGSLKAAERAIVDTVFHSDQPSRRERRSLNGFRPDAWSLSVEREGIQALLPLAHCVLLTERGGLDDAHSGRAVLWTPALGLEVFAGIGIARQALARRLKDPVDSLTLLENLAPQKRQPHQRYTLGALRLIEDDVLHNRAQSGIEHFLARCDQVREHMKDKTGLPAALDKLKRTLIDTNLPRAIHLAKAINQQQTLPAWLGMAPVAEQQLHLELLEQWHNSVVDNKDYLSGVPTLQDYVDKTLQSLLDSRFTDSKLAPKDIEITPNLTLAGPALTLGEFALNHVNIAQGTGFKVASKTTQKLPKGFDQAAVNQLLLSLEIPSTFAAQVTEALTGDSTEVQERKQRFYRQIPWQLLQHAHAMKLQQRLSGTAFDQICQVLDMPDGIARATVEGAHALVSPLSLIKTAGTDAVEALGLYVIGPGTGHKGPSVLYTPYADQVFHEFEGQTQLIAALNSPGPLQDLLIRRLPAEHQAVFRALLKSSVGETSEMTLSGAAITGNLLHRLFKDNLQLLTQFLGCQGQSTAQGDWENAKNLFSHGIKLLSGLLPGKLSYLTFLWQAYKDFKVSAEALQDHHWAIALKAFIDGGMQMISLGRIALEGSEASAQAPEVAVATARVRRQTPATVATITEVTTKAVDLTKPLTLPVPRWSTIRLTSPLRTVLQVFEAVNVALEGLKRNAKNGTYEQSLSKRIYNVIAGKVYRVEKPGIAWRIVTDQIQGPSLKEQDKRLLLAPDPHTVHYGKAISRLHNRFVVEQSRRTVLNIEAKGMENIRRHHPDKAHAIQHAVDMARFYAFNSLHNLVQLKNNVSGSRLNGFLKSFFGVSQIDKVLLGKINNAIVPICNTLVDPDEDLMNTDRFIVGSNVFKSSLIAFVLINDKQKNVHFTEHFFNQQLDLYEGFLSESFDVNGHAQAATLIHEFAHQFSKAEDIASLEARRPFFDLIDPLTHYGQELRNDLESFQSKALSLLTPRDELFAHWSAKKGAFVSLDKIRGGEVLTQNILKLTQSSTIDEARNKFYDRTSSDVRADVILRNADSIARLICEMGRRLDPVPVR
ncbi:dermonecrotic toxin domain-containing protein [Pseudomonas sp. NPDC087817]|uniref:dermonecrotic toxin domain-containing protein n=1 Tax=Pseudomonas sp. NPDC087817 TaxID=3364451 RepID=UPI0038154599